MNIFVNFKTSTSTRNCNWMKFKIASYLLVIVPLWLFFNILTSEGDHFASLTCLICFRFHIHPIYIFVLLYNIQSVQIHKTKEYRNNQIKISARWHSLINNKLSDLCNSSDHWENNQNKIAPVLPFFLAKKY